MSTSAVAVVGAGISGAACARALTEAGVPVRLLDRGQAAGGRMASRRLEGRYVDLGASYFTVREPEFAAVVTDWQQRGLAREWTSSFHVAGPTGLGELKPGPVRYGAAGGLRSLVEDLLTGLDIVTSTEVGTVGPGATVDGEAYAAVVLAMPDPQALMLLDPSLSAAREAIADRQWEPVIALAAGFAARSWDDAFDGCFVNDSDVLSWIADDGRRRGDDAPVLVAHSTPGFAATRLSDPDAATPALVAALRQVCGLGVPEWTFTQRWSLAKPTGPREELCFLEDGIGLCGDGWGASKVEAAWLSGTRLGQALARRSS
ncbi:MAG: FAD-dependent oxidoreductase [Frankiales bacterium]|nr:FAD-dependent oxidoreductase [Frankiales bacterium]